MIELLRTAASVSTPFGLLGLLAVVILIAYQRNLKHKERQLQAVDPKERAKAIDSSLARYGLHAKDLTTEQKFKLLMHELDKRFRLARIAMAIAAVTFVICFVISVYAYVNLKGSGNLWNTAEGPAELILDVHRTEYTNFVVFPNGEGATSTFVPPKSFLLTDEGLAVEYTSVKTKDRIPDYPTGKIPPHIPDGEMITDFTVSCKSGSTTIKAIHLLLDNVTQIESADYLGLVKPMLAPIEDTVVIRRNIREYSMFKQNVFAYKKGDVDLFRISALVADQEEPAIFQFRVRIDFLSDTGIRSVYSPVFFLAKVNSGETKRIPVEKRPKQDPQSNKKPISTATEDILKIAQSRTDFDRNQEYHKEYELVVGAVRAPNRVSSVEELKLKYHSVFANEFVNLKRSKSEGRLQRDLSGKSLLRLLGYLELGSLPKFDEQLRPLLGDTWIINQWKLEGDHGEYFVANTDNSMVIYAWRNTQDYRALMIGCKYLAQSSDMKAQLAMSEFLVQAIENPIMSISGIVDTIPLIAYFNNQAAYEGLCRLLKHTNKLVKRRVIQVFSSVRYAGAAPNLLDILEIREMNNSEEDFLLSAPNNSHLQLYTALAVNGNKEVFLRVLDLVRKNRIPETETKWAAYVLLWSNPEESIELAKKLVTQGNGPGLKPDVGFYILDAALRAGPPLRQYSMFDSQFKTLLKELFIAAREKGAVLAASPIVTSHSRRIQFQ